MKVYSSWSVSPQVSTLHRRSETSEVTALFPNVAVVVWKTAKSIGGNDMKRSLPVGCSCQAEPPLQGCADAKAETIIVQSSNHRRPGNMDQAWRDHLVEEGTEPCVSVLAP